MGALKEAVVFIPGFGAKSQDYYLEKLLTIGLTSRLEDRRVDLEREAVKISGQSGKRFIAYEQSGDKKILDIYEIYWLDLMEKLGEKSLKEQVFRGLYLFIFCFSSQIWSMAQQSRILLGQLMLAMFLLGLWYYGNVAIALTAIGKNPSALGDLGVSLPPEIASILTQIGESMGSWPIWVTASLLLGLLPISITNFVNQIDFTAHYLEDDVSAEVGSLRNRIRLRVKMALDDALKQGEYERVTVLAHSMGVAIAVDLLADYYNPTDIPIRVITLGGQIELFSYKTHWILEESSKCLSNPAVVSWVDFYSKQDWLCTPTPLPNKVQGHKFRSSAIRFQVPLSKQISGEPHIAYFFDHRVLENLLES